MLRKKKLLDHGHNKTLLLQTWFQPHNQYDLLILFFQIPNNTSICPLFPNWVWLWMELLFSTLIMIYRTNKTTIAQNNLSGLLHGNIICFYSVCVCVSSPNCALVNHYYERSEIHLSCHKGTKRLSVRYMAVGWSLFAGNLQHEKWFIKGGGTVAAEFLHSCWVI